MPVPASELPILDALSLLRARLQALKRARTEYVKSQDVFQLYKEALQQVTRLTEVREANERSRDEEAELAQHTSAAMARLRVRAGTPQAGTSTNAAPLPDTVPPTTTTTNTTSLDSAEEDEAESANAKIVEPLPTPAAAQAASAEPSTSTSTSTSTPGSNTNTSNPAPVFPHELSQGQEMNRVDTALADIFHLLSLFFLTIGKSRSPPATYCQLAILKKLLDHMKESGIYTQTDLVPFKNRLAELREMITAEVDFADAEDQQSAPHPDQQTPFDKTSMSEDAVSHAALTKLLLRKCDQCRTRLDELLESLSVISADLVPLHQKIIYLRRHLVAIGAKGLKVNKPELDQVAEEMRKIESSRTQDGKFVVTKKNAETGVEETIVPTQGQQILSGVMEETFEILQEIQSRDEEVDVAIKPIFDRLTEIRTQLEKLILTHRWTLRETDLYNFQVSLQEIDRMRVNGKFVDAEGNKPHGQRVLLFNLRRCYGLIYRLMSSSEPISEELMPIANKLSTIRRCLNEVLKFGGPFSGRDLYPYQLALAQIEAIRKDGKFPGRDGSLPEGQGILNAHLSESYEMIEMLKEDMDPDV